MARTPHDDGNLVGRNFQGEIIDDLFATEGLGDVD